MLVHPYTRRMHRLFIEPQYLSTSRVTLRGTHLKKVQRVLRLKVGDIVYLFDGSGYEYRAVIVRLNTREGELQILEKDRPLRESPLQVSLAQSLPKADKMSLIVQKATELGVQEIHPFYSQRTVSTYDGTQADSRVRRWQKVAEEASRQSGRSVVPRVFRPVPLEELLRSPSPESRKLVLHTGDQASSLRDFFRQHRGVTSVWFLVGPEGGFSAEELALCVKFSFLPVSLGKRILRTETTALAFLSVLQYELGDMS